MPFVHFKENLLGVRFVAEVVFALNVCPIHPTDSHWDSNMAIWTAIVAMQYCEI
jgi:hypothetical protein